MQGARPTLSVVIVTWNGRNYVRECLRSLAERNDHLATELIVVDNASTDGTTEMLSEDISLAKLVKNTRNYGFAKANNIGIGTSKGEFVCLINSDVVVAPDCLNHMHQFMLENPSVGVLGPQMLCPDGRIGRSYMRFPTVWRSFCYASGLSALFGGHAPFAGFLMRDFDNETTSEVEVLNGWFLMVRRTALADVGVLDDTFFMYGEDIDWAFRFKKANWKSVYFAGARALHYGGASSAVAPTRFYVEMYRANLQYWRKHHGRLGQCAYWMILVLHHVVRALAYGVVHLLAGKSRPESALKASRSAACIKWLFGLRQGS